MAMRTDQRTKLTCSLCSSKYSFKSGLSRHMKDKHPVFLTEEGDVFGCQLCGKRL